MDFQYLANPSDLSCVKRSRVESFNSIQKWLTQSKGQEATLIYDIPGQRQGVAAIGRNPCLGSPSSILFGLGFASPNSVFALSFQHSSIEPSQVRLFDLIERPISANVPNHRHAEVPRRHRLKFAAIWLSPPQQFGSDIYGLYEN